MLIAKPDDGLDRPFLEGLFAGSNVDTVDGITEPYRATRHEPHKVLTLPITDRSSTDAAFAKLRGPDLLTGDSQYSAEGFGKTDAREFASLGQLPPVLIVQLRHG
jgi:hypothetical protein